MMHAFLVLPGLYAKFFEVTLLKVFDAVISFVEAVL